MMIAPQLQMWCCIGYMEFTLPFAFLCVCVVHTIVCCMARCTKSDFSDMHTNNTHTLTCLCCVCTCAYILTCVQEKFPIQPSPDSPLAQVLRQVRGHVQTLPGHLVLWSLLATVATIWLLKTLLSGILGGRKAKPTPAEPKAKKAKDQPAEKSASASSLKAERENSEESRRDADKSPKKRK